MDNNIKDTINCLFFGDFRAANPLAIRIDNKVTELISKGDINVCNFEAPLHNSGMNAIKKSGPTLSQSEKSPAFLTQNGFNVILLANNHVMDYGKEGCELTIKAFSNVVTVGAGSANEAFSVQFVEVKGKKIGFCSLVQNEFGTVESKCGEGYGAAWINSLDVPFIIDEAKHQCDFLFVCPHAGVEHTVAPLPEWRLLYKHFIDWGADAVIASHPHSPQGWEDYKGKRIYYSLGNFYFDELTYDTWWFKSIVLEMKINTDDTIDYVEHFICFNTDGQIMLDNSEIMRNRIEYANHLLKDDEKYNNYIDELCRSSYKRINYGMLRGLCGFSFKMKLKYVFRLLACMLLGNTDEPYLLNAIRCESHRWVLQRALTNRLKKEKNN